MSSTSAQRICFTHETAFQLLRTAEQRPPLLPRSALYQPPACPPNARELEQALLRLEAAHPAVGITQPVHLLISQAAHRRPSNAYRAHVHAASLPGRLFHRLGDTALISTATFSFSLIAAQTKTATSLLELGYELCGSYQTRRTAVNTAYQVEPLTSIRALKDFATLHPSLRGAKKIARVLRYITDGSASPRETKQALILGLPLMYGGYGLGMPHMNYKVEATPAARTLTGKTSFRCDLCWPEAKLDVEYQSKEHHSGEIKRISDSRRTNALAFMGWNVVCITNSELDSMVATDLIAETIRRYLRKRTCVRFSDYHARKLKLRRQLGLPIERF